MKKRICFVAIFLPLMYLLFLGALLPSYNIDMTVLVIVNCMAFIAASSFTVTALLLMELE